MAPLKFSEGVGGEGPISQVRVVWCNTPTPNDTPSLSGTQAILEDLRCLKVLPLLQQTLFKSLLFATQIYHISILTRGVVIKV